MQAEAFVYGKTGNSNPGDIFVHGFIVNCDGEVVSFYNKNAGWGTNMQSIYYSIIEALESTPSDITDLNIFTSQEVVVRQLRGIYHIKESKLNELHRRVMDLIEELGIRVNFQWVRKNQMMEVLAKVREENRDLHI